MSIRRGWTPEQDKILKFLKEQRNLKKWSSIASIMDLQFNMCGRNGKQCRERYNNHLEQGIIEQKLNLNEQRLLQKLNDQIGNKWSVIAKAFPGRTANFLKNQLYSKLRKAVRKLNKFIKELKMKSVRQYKLNIVYKIVQSNDFKIFQKQRHNPQDLIFYSEIKGKLFIYAQNPLAIQNFQTNAHLQMMEQSQEIIEKLNLFSKKYEAFSKKIKKPRRRYFSQDDVILNSLSNNKAMNGVIANNVDNILQQSGSKMSSSQNNESSVTSDKQNIESIVPEVNRLEIRVFQTKNFDQQKYKDFYQKQIDQNVKRRQCKMDISQLEKRANENHKIVEESGLGYIGDQFRLLEQSEQGQYLDIQYMEQFKSCSFIDQSLFQ